MKKIIGAFVLGIVLGSAVSVQAGDLFVTGALKKIRLELIEMNTGLRNIATVLWEIKKTQEQDQQGLEAN